jgi:hypothetical protein
MAAPHSELESFLDAQRREGESLDTASFTINHVKARAKLSRYQLGEPGLWLVKLIQAANACKAPRIEVTFGRRKVRVKFRAPEGWQAEEIYLLLLKEGLSDDRALSHLATGLRALIATLSETVTLSVGVSTVTLDGKGSRTRPYQGGQDFFLETTRPSRGLAWKGLFRVPFSHILQQTLEEWTALAGRCWVGPAELVVDGRTLRTVYNAVPHHDSHPKVLRMTTRLKRCLGSRPLYDVQGRPVLPFFPRGVEEVEITNDLDPYSTFMRWSPREEPPRGTLSFHTSRLVSPTVDFVLDGAVVESRLIQPMVEHLRKLPSLIVPRYIFSVRPEELDISGFGVRNIDHLKLVRQSQEESQALRRVTLDEITKHYRGFMPDEKKYLSMWLDKLGELLFRF